MGTRSEHGQATVEHLGIVALVALVMLGAGAISAVAAPGLLNRVTGGFQRALCVVTGQACLVLADEPCPERRQTDRSSQAVTVGWLRLGHDRVLFIERRSDGTYLLSLMEGARAGAGVARGVRGGGGDAEGEADLTAGWKGGRQYVAATPDEARALVRRLRSDPVPALSTEVAAAMDLAGLRDADRSVDAYVLTGDVALDAVARFGFKGVLEGGAEFASSEELGVKIAAHRKELTAYVKADAKISAFYDAFTKAGVKGAELSSRTPTRLEGALSGTVALRFGPGPKLLGVEVVVSASTSSRQRELRARLDPSEPAVAAAIAQWRRNPTDAGAVHALGAAAAEYGALDDRTFALTDSEQTGGLAGATAKVAAGLELTDERAIGLLEEQRSRPSGGVWETRLDCGTAAAA